MNAEILSVESEERLSTNFSLLKELIEKRNVAGLKELGVACSKQALEYDDSRLVEIAVVSYAISKLMEKPYIYSTSSWKEFVKRISKSLQY